MPNSNIGLFPGDQRSNWIRLRTLIFLRWVAIIGQLTAITVADRLYGLTLEMGLCYLAVGVSIIGNLIAISVFPENKRLSEIENFLMVLFDLLQLAFLLYLTGGLHNPFALLLLGPVTMSAVVLTLRSTLMLGLTAVVVVTLLAEYHVPLRTEQGFVLRIPDLFVFGNWAAIIIAVIFTSVYSRRITFEMNAMTDALTATQMALSREQKLTDLGGVVAAAAHELGTPLATITLTSSELVDDLKDLPQSQEDAMLIREQADRCRDILRNMGQAGNVDLHLQQAPLITVIEEAAEPHMERGKNVHIEMGGPQSQQPSVLRQPEIIHGLRNLIQNAVDFARANIWIVAEWTEDDIVLRIQDDGRGFPNHLLGRIGDPFLKNRRTQSPDSERPAYEGMGLGLFIAKTLLERSGAEIRFANANDTHGKQHEARERRGAIVEVTWPRTAIDAVTGENAVPFGENRPLRI